MTKPNPYYPDLEREMSRLMDPERVTLEQMARRTGLAKWTVNRMRHGIRPVESEIRKFATAIGEPVSNWLEWAGYPTFQATGPYASVVTEHPVGYVARSEAPEDIDDVKQLIGRLARAEVGADATEEEAAAVYNAIEAVLNMRRR